MNWRPTTALQFKEGAPAKELYIGSAGISDENYRRLVVDWRSPVAEVYYNQTMGPTSYVADGRGKARRAAACPR